MGKAAADSATGQKMLPADCISILLMALGSPSISKNTFEMMSALDGTRTASSFEHQFRPVTAKAKEFKRRADAGETFSPVTPPRKRGANMSPPATPRKRKAASEEDEGTPTKKPAKKNTPKPRAKKTVEVHDEHEDDDKEQPANDLDGEDFPLDADVFIKSEKNWEEGFA